MKIAYIYCFCSIMFFNAVLPGYVSSNESRHIISKNFCYTVIIELLNIDMPASFDEQLKSWKRWSKETAPYIDKVKLSKDEMKVYFLIIYISDARNIIATQEFIAETILDKFIKNHEIFLETLNELPHFIPVVSSMINIHFSTFSNDEEKTTFLNKYSSMIMKTLGDIKGKACLKYINKRKSYF